MVVEPVRGIRLPLKLKIPKPAIYRHLCCRSPRRSATASWCSGRHLAALQSGDGGLAGPHARSQLGLGEARPQASLEQLGEGWSVRLRCLGSGRHAGGRRCRGIGRRAGFSPPPVNRSSTERTASRVLRSFTASSSGAEAGERRIRLSGSGKISGSSHGPCTTNGRSKPGAAFGAEVRLATPFRSYSRAGTEAVPVKVRRAAGPSTRTSSAVAIPSLNFTAMVRLS